MYIVESIPYDGELNEVGLSINIDCHERYICEMCEAKVTLYYHKEKVETKTDYGVED